MMLLRRGSLVYAGSPVGLSSYLETFGRQIPQGENPLEYFLDVIKEYDQSTLGLDPLVQFQRYGTKPTTEMKTPQPRTPAYRTTLQGSGTPAQMMNYHTGFGTSQRNHQQARAGTPQMNHQGAQTPHQLDRIHEESVEEAWTTTDLELEEEEFDASLVRSTPMNNFGNPKLASQFYKNFSVWLYTEVVESVWKTPARSAWPATTPGRTPGRTPARTPGRTPGKTPGRTPARIPGRFPSMNGTSTFEKVPLPIVVAPSPSTVQFADAMQTLDCMPDSSHNFTTSSLYDSELSDDDFLDPKFANPWRRELRILMWRNVKNVIRTPELFLSREIVFVVMSTMLSSLFKHLDAQNDITIAYNLLNFYIFAVCLLFFSSNDAVPSFIQERFIFIRETSHNAYRASSYVMSSFLVYLPFFAVQAATFAILTFFPMKLNGSVIILWIVLFASLLTSNSFVMFVSAVVPNYITGYAVVIASTALFFLQCGFFLKRTQIPIEWKWLHFMSIIKYPFEGLLINQFNSDLGFCYSAVQDPTPGPVGKVVQDPGFNKRPSGCYTGGPDILYSMGILNSKDFNQDKILISVLILLAWGALYRLLFYVILRFYSKNLRK